MACSPRHSRSSERESRSRWPDLGSVCTIGYVSGQNSQGVRMFDVFLLGPAMIIAGSQARNPAVRSVVMAAGAGTILYNGANYLAVQRRRRRERQRT
jgi:hypothetical protein